MAYFKNSKKISKSERLAKAVSRRFASPKQELAIQTTAGILREAVAGKGGHNSPRVPFKRKEDGTRDMKVPYDKVRWGTLGLSEISTTMKKDHNLFSRPKRRQLAQHLGNPFVAYTTGKTVHQLPHQVGRQLQKANAYKAKLNSKKWKRGRAQ